MKTKQFCEIENKYAGQSCYINVTDDKNIMKRVRNINIMERVRITCTQLSLYITMDYNVKLSNSPKQYYNGYIG